MTLRPKFRHWANCNCKYDKLYSTVGGKPLLGCRTRRIPSEPRQSVLVILQERMAIYLKIYVLHGPIQDSCTRAHGKLVTPLGIWSLLRLESRVWKRYNGEYRNDRMLATFWIFKTTTNYKDIRRVLAICNLLGWLWSKYRTHRTSSNVYLIRYAFRIYMYMYIGLHIRILNGLRHL